VAPSKFRSLDLELPAVPKSVPRARRAIAAMLEGLDVDLWPVGLVVSEAVTNVVLHAYRDREPGRVRMEATVADGLLTVVVADDGIGMSPRADSPGLGVGLVLIRRLAARGRRERRRHALARAVATCAGVEVVLGAVRGTLLMPSRSTRGSDGPEVRRDVRGCTKRLLANRRSAQFNGKAISLA